ncbi:MAG: hypothetical protein AAGN35_12705 [Bacteroidota bacterium]
MKYLTIAIVALGFGLSLTSCGGNADAEKFCKCFERYEKGEESACDDEMEALEGELKQDEARYEAFREAAMKSCPDAKKFIDRMN